MLNIEQAVLQAVEERTDKHPVTLSSRLDEDLWLDGMESAAIALALEKQLHRKPSAEAYRTIFTVADLVSVFEAAAPSP